MLEEHYILIGNTCLIPMIGIPGAIYFLKKRQVLKAILNLVINTTIILCINKEGPTADELEGLRKAILILTPATISAAFIGLATYRGISTFGQKKDWKKPTKETLAITGFFLPTLLHIGAIVSVILAMNYYDMKDCSRYHGNHRPGPGELPCF